MAKRKKRKVGFFTTSMEVEVVTGRQTTKCKVCDELPTGKRLRVSQGSGKWVKSEIYCREHFRMPLADLGELIEVMTMEMSR